MLGLYAGIFPDLRDKVKFEFSKTPGGVALDDELANVS